LNGEWIVFSVKLFLRDVVPEMIFYSIEKGLAAFCLNGSVESLDGVGIGR